MSASAYGIEMLTDEVIDLELATPSKSCGHVIQYRKDSSIYCEAAWQLGVPGEESCGATWVSYCATCDGAFSVEKL
ncbi:MAG: hypothetical protein ACLR23_00490 [Clostridia bacterium]